MGLFPCGLRFVGHSDRFILPGLRKQRQYSRMSPFPTQMSPFPTNNKGAGPDDFWSLHPGGCNFLFDDGSVRFIKETVDPRIFSFLSTRAGGEIVSADQF